MEPVFPGNIAGAVIRAVSRNGSKISHLRDIAGLQHRLLCAIVSRKKRQFSSVYSFSFPAVLSPFESSTSTSCPTNFFA